MLAIIIGLAYLVLYVYLLITEGLVLPQLER
jgi:hypothetical protein